MSAASALEQVLRRDRLIAIIGLGLVSGLAWAYVLTGAGLEPSTMTGMRPSVWTAADAALMLSMWWIMMIAMMTPSAAPTVLLYARVHRHALAHGREGGLAPTSMFMAGYLAAWLGFSVVATGLHWSLEREGMLSAAAMSARSDRLAGGLLIGVGLYQLSPFKEVCLSHCRAPAAFLSRHWRPGRRGALRLGVLHGAYCVGCCWMLMALLFVGGVMNLVWIAALGMFVMVEKLLPGGGWTARVAGTTLIAWGAAVLLG